MNNNTWKHPFTDGNKTEPVQSFEAFKIWLEMGNKRSLKAVAERVEKSHDTIKKYSCTWKWSERLQDKLTYENQQIHAKQLEAVMTSLDIDNNRDIFLQEVLGNLMYNITLLTHKNLDTLKTVREGKVVPNTSFDMLERLIKMYSTLEDVHRKNQQKFIDMNATCFKVHEFDKQIGYMEMLRHGREQQMTIKHKFHSVINGYINEGLLDPNKYNLAGECIVATPPFDPVGKYKDNVEQLEAPEQKEVE